MVISACALLLSCGGGDSDEVVAGQPEPGSPVAVDEVLSGGGSTSGAWTTGGLFLYHVELLPRGSLGEGDVRDRAILVSPEDQSAVEVPVPFDQPAPGAVMAGVGGDVFVLGERCAERLTTEDIAYCEPGGLQAALFSSGTRQWRDVDLPAELSRDLGPERPWYFRPVGVTTAGTVVMYIKPEGTEEIGSAPIWGFHVPTGEWRHYPDPGVEIFDYCVAGDQVVVSTGTENSGVDPNVTGVEVRVIPAAGVLHEWQSPFPPVEQVWDYTPYLGCADGVIATWGDARYATGLEDQPAHRIATDQGTDWEQVESLPDDFLFTHDVAAGGSLILFGDGGAAYALDGLRWTALDTQPWSVGTTQVWDGERVIIIDPEAREPITTVEVPG